MIGDEPLPDAGSRALGRLIYTIAGAIVVYVVAQGIAVAYLRGLFQNPQMGRAANKASAYGYPACLLLFLLIMIAVVVAYRPTGVMRRWSAAPRQEAIRRIRSIGYGIVGGIFCALVGLGAALLRHGSVRIAFLSNSIADSYGLSVGGLLMLLLLALALPIASEVVFRGVILRVFAEHASVPAAIVASALLFAFWWPVLDWYEALIVGFVSAVLYWRTRTLTASIITNAVASVGLGVLIVVLSYR